MPFVARTSRRVDPGLAVEVGQEAAGLLDDDLGRGEVPRVHADLDHRPRPRLRRPAHSPRSRRSRARARRRPRAGGTRAPGRCVRSTRSSRTAAARPRSRRPRDADAPRRVVAEPCAHAPPPRAANQRSRSAGADMMPTWRMPSRSTASSVPKSGTPRTKLCVPSIGSMYQRTSALAAPPCRIPRRRGRVRDRRRAMRSRSRGSMALSACVTSDRSGLALIWRSRRKCAHRDPVGLVDPAQGALEPARSSASVPRRRAALRSAPDRGHAESSFLRRDAWRRLRDAA